MRPGIAAFSLLMLAACGGDDGVHVRRAPVVLLAIDGLEWSVLGPLIDSGRAPNLGRLAGRGIAGKLATDRPTLSPRIWTSVATGVRPETHGVVSFAELDPETGEIRPDGLPFTSNARRVPAIWNVCGEHGRTVLSVGWWSSWPAEEVPAGRIVASYAAQAQVTALWKAGVWADGLERLTYPPELQSTILPLLHEGAPDGLVRAEFDAAFDPVPHAAGWEVEAVLENKLRFAYHGDRTHERIFVEQLEREVADLDLLYLGLPDVAGHYFWRYREPGAFEYPIPLAKRAVLRDRIDEVYARADAWVGEVLETLPVDATVIVASDHGMHAAFEDDSASFPSGGHEDAPPGVLIAAGPGIAPRGPAKEPELVGSIYDLYPTLLMLLDLAVPDDAVGAARTDWMRPEWLAAHPIARVATYADGFRPATRPIEPPGDANAAFLEEMRALGYF